MNRFWLFVPLFWLILSSHVFSQSKTYLNVELKGHAQFAFLRVDVPAPYLVAEDPQSSIALGLKEYPFEVRFKTLRGQDVVAEVTGYSLQPINTRSKLTTKTYQLMLAFKTGKTEFVLEMRENETSKLKECQLYQNGSLLPSAGFQRLNFIEIANHLTVPSIQQIIQSRFAFSRPERTPLTIAEINFSYNHATYYFQLRANNVPIAPNFQLARSFNSPSGQKEPFEAVLYKMRNNLLEWSEVLELDDYKFTHFEEDPVTRNLIFDVDFQFHSPKMNGMPMSLRVMGRPQGMQEVFKLELPGLAVPKQVERLNQKALENVQLGVIQPLFKVKNVSRTTPAVRQGNRQASTNANTNTTTNHPTIVTGPSGFDLKNPILEWRKTLTWQKLKYDEPDQIAPLIDSLWDPSAKVLSDSKRHHLTLRAFQIPGDRFHIGLQFTLTRDRWKVQDEAQNSIYWILELPKKGVWSCSRALDTAFNKKSAP